MCEECDEVDTLREVYLARRARIARTWSPRRPWVAEAIAVPAQPSTARQSPEPAPVAAAE